MLSIEPLPPFASNVTVNVSGSLVVILQLKSESAKTHAITIRAAGGEGGEDVYGNFSLNYS